MDRSWMATWAGILEIVSGVLALLGGMVLAFAGTTLTLVPELSEEPVEELPLAVATGIVWALLGLCLLAALLMVVGGVAALRRSGWGWPLAGAITALFCVLPLGLFALILVVMAEPELRGGGRGEELATVPGSE